VWAEWGAEAVITRILLADGEPLFREGLAQLLATQRDLLLVGEASDSWEAVQKVRALRPDLALVALDLPGMGGAETARRIHSANPATKVIMLAPPRCNGEPLSLEGAADGVLLRSVRASQFFAEIREIVGGREAPGHDSLAVSVLQETGGADMRGRLTPRERAVFELVAEGWSNRQIQNALGIRESTVKRHVRRMLRKLHVRNRVQAAVYAARSSLQQREGVKKP
jgi:DNA-binding NarL/FixJ family response regulator